jgi:hypothetical protein
MSEKGAKQGGKEKISPMANSVLAALRETELAKSNPDEYLASVTRALNASVKEDYLGVDDAGELIATDKSGSKEILRAVAECVDLEISTEGKRVAVVYVGSESSKNDDPKGAEGEKAESGDETLKANKEKFGTNLGLLVTALQEGDLRDLFRDFVKSSPDADSYQKMADSLLKIYSAYIKDSRVPSEKKDYFIKQVEILAFEVGRQSSPTERKEKIPQPQGPIEEVVNPGYTEVISEAQKAENQKFAKYPKEQIEMWKYLQIIYDKENEALQDIEDLEKQRGALSDELKYVVSKIEKSGDDITVAILRLNYQDSENGIHDQAIEDLFNKEAALKEQIDALDVKIFEEMQKYAAEAMKLELTSKIIGKDTDDSHFIKEALEKGINPADALKNVMVQEGLNPSEGRSYGAIFAMAGYESLDPDDKITVLRLISEKKIIITENHDYLIPGDMMSEDAQETRRILIEITDKLKQKIANKFFGQTKEILEMNAQDKYLRSLEISNMNVGGLTELIRMVGDESIISEVRKLIESGDLKIDLTGDVVPSEDKEGSINVYNEIRSRLIDSIDVLHYNQSEMEIRHSIEGDPVMAKAEVRLREVQEKIQELDKRINLEDNAKFRTMSTRMVAYVARWVHRNNRFKSDEHASDIDQYRDFEAALNERHELTKEYNELSVLIERTRAELQMRVSGLAEVKSAFSEQLSTFDSQDFDFAAVDTVMLKADIANFYDNPPSSARNELAGFVGENPDEDFEIKITNAEARELVSEEKAKNIEEKLKEELENYFREVCRNKKISRQQTEAIISTCWEIDSFKSLFETCVDQYVLQDGFVRFLGDHITTNSLTIEDGAMVRTILGDVEECQFQKRFLESRLKEYFIELATRSRKVLGFESMKSTLIKSFGKSIKLSDEQSELLAGNPDFSKIIEFASLEIDEKIKKSGLIASEVAEDGLIESEAAAEVKEVQKASSETVISVSSSGYDSYSDGGSESGSPVRSARSNVSSSINSVNSGMARNNKEGGFLGFVKGLMTAILGI